MTNDKGTDIDIEIYAGNPQEAGVVQLPSNFVQVGEIESDDIKVYIHNAVYNDIEQYAKSDTARELGTILLGDYVEYSGKTHVIISACIIAKYTDATASTLTFTHETWDYVHKEHARLYPALKILGWQHTHPGYGIFLSNYDMFIQENFFNLPFQVAYVIDPKQDLRGFFQWKGGKVEKLRGYYIYNEVGAKITVPVDSPKQETKVATRQPKKTTALLLSLFILSVAISASSIALTRSFMVSQVARQSELSAQVVAQNEVINALNNSFIDLQNEYDSMSINQNDFDEIKELTAKVESQQKQIDEQKQTIGELRELIGSAKDTPSSRDEAIVFAYYTVEHGDTLTGICAKLAVDYEANADIIKAMNGISDPNRIFVGQVLLLPMKQQQTLQEQ